MPHQWRVREAKMMGRHRIRINDLVFPIDDKNRAGKARQDFFGFVIGAPQRLLCLLALADIPENAPMKDSVLGRRYEVHGISFHLRILPLRIAVESTVSEHEI